ncbi:GNAT family N-acetyltransferase [Roseovarius aestuariivivens]|uniref:GNAT family N-acetyltransferase n=1 Tax=Roseovarius aestuariivivens TaxID=1888910 RepID=UPI00108125F2|nr:GNAT family N-acetyltransferase [Roseovarius aestuariivivens]
MSHVLLSEDHLIPPPAPAALQQHSNYGAALRALGVTVNQLQADGATALLVRRRIGPVGLSWLPRGPVIAQDGNAARLLDHLPRGVSVAISETDQALNTYRAAGFRPILQPRQVAELNLTASVAARMAAQHGKWRNRLRRALDGPLQVSHRRFDPVRDVPFLALEDAQRREKRYAALPRAFTQAYAATAPEATRLFLAHHHGELAGFVLLLLHAPVATYHIGWTGTLGRRLGAHPLLLWQAAGWLAQDGFTRLDLGSLDRDMAPGLARFKLGFGAASRPLGPTLLRLRRLTPARAAA